MSFETDIVAEEQRGDYESLKIDKARLETQVANWVDRATTLHTNVGDPAKQAEIVAQRDAFVLALRTSLGV